MSEKAGRSHRAKRHRIAESLSGAAFAAEYYLGDELWSFSDDDETALTKMERRLVERAVESMNKAIERAELAASAIRRKKAGSSDEEDGAEGEEEESDDD